ncbi:AAA family ATPase [Streptomyces griseoviridis]|uniref:AAA family ATPase n=1 Tax=Streptomyces griseoviridis TaxID=45398 RepID=A0A3Q9KUP3_STRGD|nr:AAA family ATPase [Streptomyces griseoviridis]AZS86453.1 AAA family ATPase [Streptomyces griseoviridis]QCN86682.1 AAA family ATPase [Streptomyces griseoviridis]
MYIERVVLKNIKGFETSDLNFTRDDGEHAGWAVITGDNGSGKTALLKSICMAILGPDDSRVLLTDNRGWVTEGKDSGTASVEIKPFKEYDRTKRGGYPVQNTFWAEIGFSREVNAWVISGSVDVFRHKKRGAFNGPWAPGTQGWFALGYGPFRRLYGSSPDAQRLMVIPGRVPRFATLFKEDATLAEGEQWVKQLKYKKLEQKESEEVTLDYLLELLNDDFLRQGVAVDEVNSEGIWLTDPAGRRMPLSDMSEGYRSALAMLIDIFRHMVDVYGITGLTEKRGDGTAYVNRPGVVIIDEVDSHLHPAWQREIGFWLKKHFPLVQFIVTTHSPLVCQAADGGRIYHMPQPGQGESPFQLSPIDFNRVIAGKPDQILLTPAFGMSHTRSPQAVNANRRHSRLRAKQIAGKLSTDEYEELEQLSLFAEAE